jgi:hypothetical protein
MGETIFFFHRNYGPKPARTAHYLTGAKKKMPKGLIRENYHGD